MADVLNRETKELLQSVHTPRYPERDWVINPDLTAVQGVSPKYWKISGSEITEMVPEDKAAVDRRELAAYKWQLVTRIDEDTRTRCEAGFEFEGHTFSMSTAAQCNWNSLGMALALGMTVFPVSVSTAAGGRYVLQDQQACLRFIAEYMRYQLDPEGPLCTGRDLRVQVLAAQTKEEVDAVAGNG